MTYDIWEGLGGPGRALGGSGRPWDTPVEKKGPIFGEKKPPEAAPRWRDRLLKKKGSIFCEKTYFQ